MCERSVLHRALCGLQGKDGVPSSFLPLIGKPQPHPGKGWPRAGRETYESSTSRSQHPGEAFHLPQPRNPCRTDTSSARLTSSNSLGTGFSGLVASGTIMRVRLRTTGPSVFGVYGV